jgi:hypothetical protein
MSERVSDEDLETLQTLVESVVCDLQEAREHNKQLEAALKADMEFMKAMREAWSDVEDYDGDFPVIKNINRLLGEEKP